MPSFVLIDNFEIKAKIGGGDVFDTKIRGFVGAISFHHDGQAFDAPENLFAVGIVNIYYSAAPHNQQIFE